MATISVLWRGDKVVHVRCELALDQPRWKVRSPCITQASIHSTPHRHGRSTATQRYGNQVTYFNFSIHMCGTSVQCKNDSKPKAFLRPHSSGVCSLSALANHSKSIISIDRSTRTGIFWPYYWFAFLPKLWARLFLQWKICASITIDDVTPTDWWNQSKFFAHHNWRDEQKAATLMQEQFVQFPRRLAHD